VDVISDGTVDVQSAYLTANPYVITNGYNLGNNAGASLNRRYPVLSFEKLYGELRKALALYASLEFIGGIPTIIIEPESYWFQDAPIGYSISDFPYGMTINVDEDRIYSLSKIGSSDVDVDSEFNPFDNQRLDGWLLRTYNTCGCIFDRDNEQNLEAEFIYDSGKIFKALVDRDETDPVFLIEIDPVTGQPAKYLRVPTINVFYYNDTLRNKNIAQRWASLFLNCAYDDRVSDVSFRAFSEFEDGDPLSCNLQRFNIAPTPISATGNMLYFRTDYDTFGGLSQPANSGDIVGSVGGCGKSRFTIPVDGSYAFSASRDFFFQYPVLTGSNTVTFDVLFIIRAFDSGGGIKFSSSTLQQHVAVAPSDIWSSTIANDTPLWSLVSGDYVEVIFTFQIVSSPSGLNVFGLFGVGEFKNNDELMACFDINPEGNRIPYLIESTVPMCNADFRLITENRRGYVDLNGIKGWVKRLEYTPDKTAVLQLLTAEIPCCVEAECCTYRVEGVELRPRFCITFPEIINISDWGNATRFTFFFNAGASIGSSGIAVIEVTITPSPATITAAQILAQWIAEYNDLSDILDTYSENIEDYLTYTISGNTLCIQAQSLYPIDLTGDAELLWSIGFFDSIDGVATTVQDVDLSEVVIATTFGVPNITLDGANALSEDYSQPVPLLFQVLLNGTWTTIDPEEIVDGVWTRETCDQITEARIIDSEGNVIETLTVECL
jgi:hypothetical protein